MTAYSEAAPTEPTNQTGEERGRFWLGLFRSLQDAQLSDPNNVVEVMQALQDRYGSLTPDEQARMSFALGHDTLKVDYIPVPDNEIA